MNKKNIIKYVLAAEVLLFTIFYYRGAHGLRAVHELQQENSAIEQVMQQEKLEISKLEDEIIRWQSDPFYKEKLAREQLHMARKDEEIYLIDIPREVNNI